MTPATTRRRCGTAPAHRIVVGMIATLTSLPAVAIVAGEILFWVLLAGGLGARYLLHTPRLGLALLAGTLAVDVGVLAVAVTDLRSGAAATVVHGLSALYVGCSIAFGRTVVRWADGHAAHRWAGGPAPRRVPRRGPERAAHEWQLFGRWLAGAAITAGLLGLAIVTAGPAADVEALRDWYPRLLTITAIWFATGPLWHLRERTAPTSEGSVLEREGQQN
jgi:hypothetical protein